MTTPDLDAPRCVDCCALLPVTTFALRDDEPDEWFGCGLLVWPDGSWHQSCASCGWERTVIADAAEPTPSYRTIAPELCAEIERLNQYIEAAHDAMLSGNVFRVQGELARQDKR